MKASKAKQFILPVLVFTAGMLIGFFAGESGNAGGAGPKETSTIPESVRQAVLPVKAARSSGERMRATVHLARSIPLAEISEWLDQRWHPHPNDLDGQVFERILAERWLEGDPAGMANSRLLENPEDLDHIIRVWSARDPEALVDWLWQIRHRDELNRLAFIGFDGLVRHKPLLALAQAPVIHARLGRSASSWLVGMLVFISREHHPEVVRASETWPASLRALAQQALNVGSTGSDFPAVIERMKREPDGVDQFVKAIASPRFASKVLEHAGTLPEGWLSAASLTEYSVFLVMDTDPKYWMDVDLTAYGLSDSLASKLLDLGMSGLMGRDIERAVRLLKRDDLRPRDRRELLVNGFARLARKDRRLAEECLAELTDPQEIARAKDSIRNASVGSPSDPVAPLKLSAPEWLEAFASERGMHDSQVKAALEWDAETVEVLRRGFAALPRDRKDIVAMKCVMFGAAAAGETRGDSSALTWLRADGIAHYLAHEKELEPQWSAIGNSREQSIIRFAIGWALEDPLSASRWAQEELPLGEMRLAIVKNVADCWRRYQPAAAVEWLQSLPDGEREQIERHLGLSP